MRTRTMQDAAGMGIYGPRTVYCIALKDAPGCHEFLLQDDGKWLHVKETTEIGAPPAASCSQRLCSVLQPAPAPAVALSACRHVSDLTGF